jgi:hypothetical protein
MTYDRVSPLGANNGPSALARLHTIGISPKQTLAVRTHLRQAQQIPAHRANPRHQEDEAVCRMEV